MNYFVLLNPDNSAKQIISCSASLDAPPEGLIQVTAQEVAALRAKMVLKLGRGDDESLPEPA